MTIEDFPNPTLPKGINAAEKERFQAVYFTAVARGESKESAEELASQAIEICPEKLMSKKDVSIPYAAKFMETETEIHKPILVSRSELMALLRGETIMRGNGGMRRTWTIKDGPFKVGLPETPATTVIVPKTAQEAPGEPISVTEIYDTSPRASKAQIQAQELVDGKTGLIEGIRQSLTQLVERVLTIARGGPTSGYHGPEHIGLEGVWGGSRPRASKAEVAAEIDSATEPREAKRDWREIVKSEGSMQDYIERYDLIPHKGEGRRDYFRRIFRTSSQEAMEQIEELGDDIIKVPKKDFSYSTWEFTLGQPDRNDPLFKDLTDEEFEMVADSFRYGVSYEREKYYDFAIRRMIAEGKLDPEEAGRKYGYADIARPQGEGEWKELPEVLYHVTTAAGAVAETGLQSRLELGMTSGRGLAGGEDDTISFTTDLETAMVIDRAFHEARLVANGSISPLTLIRWAAQGKDSERPFLGDLMKSVFAFGGPAQKQVEELNSGINLSNPPEHLASTLTHFLDYWRGKHEQEGVEATWRLYNDFLWQRGAAGGPPNPVFFGTDYEALAQSDPADFRILEYRPKQGARGYRMAGLGEWRTVGSRQLDFIGYHESVTPETEEQIIGPIERADEKAEEDYEEQEQKVQGEEKPQEEEAPQAPQAPQKPKVQSKYAVALPGAISFPTHWIAEKEIEKGMDIFYDYISKGKIRAPARQEQDIIKRGGEGSGYYAPHEGLAGTWGGSAPREGGAAETPTEAEADAGGMQVNELTKLTDKQRGDLEKVLEGRDEELRNVIVRGIHEGHLTYENVEEIMSGAIDRRSQEIQNETETSRLVNELAKQFGGNVEGFEFRIKGEDSLARKIAQDMIKKGISAEEAADDIYDALRYTLSFELEEFVEKATQVQDELMGQGWVQYDDKWKNYFTAGDGYDGYNTVMLNPETGQKFELQFHTPETWAHKMKYHDVYKQIRSMPADNPVRADLFRELSLAAAKLTKPPGWENLRGAQQWHR